MEGSVIPHSLFLTEDFTWDIQLSDIIVVTWHVNFSCFNFSFCVGVDPDMHRDIHNKIRNTQTQSHGYNWSHGDSWYFMTTFFHYPLPLPSARNQLQFLPGRMIQVFIAERYGPLVPLPEFSYNFPLNLITEFGDVTRYPRGSSIFPLWSRNPIFSC